MSRLVLLAAALLTIGCATSRASVTPPDWVHIEPGPVVLGDFTIIPLNEADVDVACKSILRAHSIVDKYAVRYGCWWSTYERGEVHHYILTRPDFWTLLEELKHKVYGQYHR